MNNPRKRPSLAEFLERAVSDRKTAARRKGGMVRGMQRALEKAKKRVRIFETEIQLIEKGEPERGMNKKIAKRTRLPYEYVMKSRREK